MPALPTGKKKATASECALELPPVHLRNCTDPLGQIPLKATLQYAMICEGEAIPFVEDSGLQLLSGRSGKAKAITTSALFHGKVSQNAAPQSACVVPAARSAPLGRACVHCA
jgi:hypothetical protein